MSGKKHQTSHVMLVHSDDRYEMVPAPIGFTWIPYPAELTLHGRRWRYFYCREALPHYKEIVDDQ